MNDVDFEDILRPRSGPARVCVTIPNKAYIALQELIKASGKTQKQIILEALYLRLSLALESDKEITL